MLTEYIVLKVTLATGIALAVFLVFCLLDVPMRVFFALATVVLYCVPNIGPLIATLLPVPILILEDFPLLRAILFAILLFFTHCLATFPAPFMWKSDF